MLAAPYIRIKPLSVFSDFSSHLTEKYFYVMLAAAIALHLMCFTVYQLLPHQEVIQIPVKALNIKLGGGPIGGAVNPIPYAAAPGAQGSTESAAAQAMVDAALGHTPLAPSATANPARSDVPLKARSISRGAAASASAMPSEYVRQGTAASGAGNPLGNTDGEGGEEIMRRYEQVLSLWIERHKVYPSNAREQAMEGDAIIRVRINREGQIIAYTLEKPTRFSVLNEAIEDMVRQASPVPAVPLNYPAGDRFEFLIPVSFRLQ